MKNIFCLIGQLGNGGSERQLALFLKHLDREKYNPFVISASTAEGRWRPFIEEGLDIPVFSLADKRHIFKIFKYRRLLSEYRPECVICWSFFLNPMCVCSGAVRFIGSLRNELEHSRKELSRLRFKSALWPARFIVNSTLLAEQLREEGIAERQISFIWNFFDRNRDFSDPVKRNSARVEYRRKYGIPENATVVAMAGRNNPVKGFDFFLDVFEKTAGKVPELHGFLAGSGSTAFAGEISERGLGDKITVAGEIKDIRFVLPLADIYFLSSEAEGMPNILIEALDAGCGLLASDVGGVKDILSFLDEDELADSVLEDRNVFHAAAKLEKLCLSPKLRTKINEKAKPCLDMMSPEKVMPEFYKIIEGV